MAQNAAVFERSGVPLDLTWRAAIDQIVASLREVRTGHVTVKFEAGIPKQLSVTDTYDTSGVVQPSAVGLSTDALRAKLGDMFRSMEYGEVRIHAVAGAAVRIETVRTKRLPLIR